MLQQPASGRILNADLSPTIVRTEEVQSSDFLRDREIIVNEKNPKSNFLVDWIGSVTCEVFEVLPRGQDRYNIN